MQSKHITAVITDLKECANMKANITIKVKRKSTTVVSFVGTRIAVYID